MTDNEKELLGIIQSHPDKEYALQKAIEIISEFAKQLSTYQEQSSACPRELT